MFVRYGKNRYVNLETVQLMIVHGEKINFFSTQGFDKNTGRFDATRNLFKITSESFGTEEEAVKWLDRFVEYKNNGEVKDQPDFK